MVPMPAVMMVMPRRNEKLRCDRRGRRGNPKRHRRARSGTTTDPRRYEHHAAD
jgi:hypothetical protein